MTTEYTGTLLDYTWLKAHLEANADDHKCEACDLGLYSPIRINDELAFTPLIMSLDLPSVIKHITSAELQELNKANELVETGE